MGWSGGGSLFSTVVRIVDSYVENPSERFTIYKVLVNEFWAYDADELEMALECMADEDTLRRAFIATGYWEEDQEW